MVVLLAMVAVAHSGCAICSNPHDCKYPAYGGIIERVDQVHGRVGSLYGPQPIFVPGDTPVTAEVPDVPSATPDANTTDESPQEGPESGRFDRRPDLPPPPDFDQLDDNLDYPPSLDESIL
ncbi:MAG: hypothetical protein O3C60_11570 [Planctomycetota bacterium]|nr:hypothetical protein [Planctomycetota bacterium]